MVPDMFSSLGMSIRVHLACPTSHSSWLDRFESWEIRLESTSSRALDLLFSHKTICLKRFGKASSKAMLGLVLKGLCKIGSRTI